LYGTSIEGNIVQLTDGVIQLTPGASFSFPEDPAQSIEVRGGLGKETITLFASTANLTGGRIFRGKNIADRVVHDFYQNKDSNARRDSAVFRRSPSPALPTRSLAAFDPTKFRAAPLPGTALEAAAILPSMTQWLAGKEPVHYRGKYALESIAKKTVSPRSLVFATHGFFSDNAEQSFDPLQRCGLLLCGCNDPNATTLDDDGVLTGAEIAEINLRGTELVVLSACETGIGRVENGNGVAGLRRSFHMAGAETVVSTLWQIPDFDTAKLMSDFFEAVAEGLPKDEALQQAQIKSIESRCDRNGAAHPFFWAGFTVSGR